ncbi:MAG: hypothetical protein ACE5F1_18695, partial [Planctomycetota bacterium]
GHAVEAIEDAEEEIIKAEQKIAEAVADGEDTTLSGQRLAEARAAGGAAGCPRTLDFLDANRLWPAGSSTPV